MKKIRSIIALALIIQSSLFAQLKEGAVTFTIEVSSDNPEMQMVTTMMNGSTLDIYFKELFTSSTMKMGQVMTVTTISDQKAGDVLMVMEGMMGKKAVKSTISKLGELKKDQPKQKVTLLEEQKVIQGYSCKKGLLTDSTGNDFVFWYTDEIIASKGGQDYLINEIPGFPLEYEINNQGLKMVMKATSIKKGLDKAEKKKMFSLKIPEGYQEMTMEELQGMGGM
jgi:GLPGLI family protein